MAHDDTNLPRSSHVPPGWCACDGCGREHGAWFAIARTAQNSGAFCRRENSGRRASTSRCSSKGPFGARIAFSGRLLPTAYASSIPPKSMAPRSYSRSGSSKPPRFASRSSLSRRTCPELPKTCSRWSISGWRRWERTTSISSSSTAWAMAGRSTRRSTSSPARNSKKRPMRSGNPARPSSSGFPPIILERAPVIQAAAEAGIVDAIMLQYAPWLDKDSPLNKALDVCWKRGVGLISMKQIASAQFGDKPKENILEVVKRKVPTLARKEPDRFPGAAARHLDRRADQRVVRLDAEHRPSARKRRRRAAIRAAQDGRHPSASRRHSGRGADDVRRLRRTLHGWPREQRPSSATSPDT